MKFKHINSKKDKSFSLIIVPHSKDTKQVRVSYWVPKIISILLVFSISITAYLTWNLYNSYEDLKMDYSEKIDRLTTLESVNIQQRIEIDTLREKTSEIEEKLKSITLLQETVKDLVGIKDSQNDSKTTGSATRGGSLLSSRYLVDNNIDFDESQDFESQIDELSQLLDQSTEELSSLIEDVEKRLKYLDAKPNLMPTTGRISSGFGNRRNPFGKGIEFHAGLDIANSSGTKVMAAGSGVVTFAAYNGGYGRVIIINHGYGYQSVYAHNRKLLVKVGEQVDKGQVIAEMGSTGRSTGPHLHFEVRLNGKAINPNNILNNFD